MKSTWKIINREKGINPQNMSVSSLTLEEATSSNQSKITSMFSDYFSSVADTINLDKNKNITTNPTHYLYNYYSNPFPELTWKYASTYETEKIIKTIESESSYGYDEISTYIIKLSALFIISPLTHICNAALSSGIFPDRLKYAIVKPIFKKGNKQDISNYRPISILTAFKSL